MEDIESMFRMKSARLFLEELQQAAKEPSTFNMGYICGRATNCIRGLMERVVDLRRALDERTAHQGEWLSVSDPLLKRLWGEYRKRTEDDEMETLVMLYGGVVATTGYFDGEDFLDINGVDWLPVRLWMPMPAPPKEDE